MATVYYLLLLTAKNCPGCINFKKLTQPELLKSIKNYPNIQFLNHEATSLMTYGIEINKIDKRLMIELAKNRIRHIPNISLVLKDQLDNKKNNIELNIFKDDMSNINKIIGWIKNVTKSEPPSKIEVKNKTPINDDIVVLKNGMKIKGYNNIQKEQDESYNITFDTENYSDSDDEFIIRW